jgi:hypothetical protein
VNFPGAFAGSFQQHISITDGAGFETINCRCSVNLPQATGDLRRCDCVSTVLRAGGRDFFITVTS